MWRNVKRLIILLVITVLLQGCSIVDAGSSNIESVMSPPKGTGDEVGIKRIISDRAGEYTFKYPQNGKYRSAVIFKDLDNDGIDEAIAFYKKGTYAGSGIYMMIVSKQGDKWIPSEEFYSNLSEIDKVCFGNIDGDEKIEIAVGLQNTNLSSNKLSVLKYENNEVTPVADNIQYSNFEFEDFDSDGLSELMLLSFAPQEKEIYTKLMKYSTESTEFETAGQVQMNKNITSYAKVSFGNVFANQAGITVDEMLSSGELATDIIYWDKQKSVLRLPFSTEKELKSKTNRLTSILSEDINGDGIIDIPLEISVLSSKNTETDTVQSLSIDTDCPIIAWSNLNLEKNTFSTVCDRIINYNDGYYITVPRTWENSVTGKIDLYNRTLTISYLKAEETGTVTLGNAILKIKAFSKYIWENALENSTEFLEITSNDTTVFAVVVYDNSGDSFMTEEVIKNSFSLI